jgi:malate dehydrogenase (oxaloacetate-decarboxylating)(NADP+)
MYIKTHVQTRAEGFLPPRVEALTEQVERTKAQLDAFTGPLDKYIFLTQLQSTNETLFYRLILEHLTELLPIVYTPTVGQACQNFDSIFRRARGMYLSPEYRGRFAQVLRNWKYPVDVIVVTDGSRILGLGDLGTNGMGIPIGKLSLYVAAGGFSPARCLPITLDVGCNNPRLVNSKFYLGRRHARIEGEEYYELWREFMEAVTKVFPGALVQFEDIALPYCADLLAEHREKYLCFNDDIQGTGAVILAGLINYLRVAKIAVKDLRVVFYGAGSAATGVADSIVYFLMSEGLTEAEARARFWFVDSKGLVATDRGDTLASHKVPYARPTGEAALAGLAEVVDAVKPHALFGLAAQGPAFTKEIVESMTSAVERPFIAALSNPTSKSEITAQEAYDFSGGKVIFASGSPFPPVQYGGRTFKTGQGNNLFVFCGIGRGACLVEATKVTDGMLLASSKALALTVTEEEIENGSLYPDVERIRDVSVAVAVGVMKQAIAEGVNCIVPPVDLERLVRKTMYVPEYGNQQE